MEVFIKKRTVNCCFSYSCFVYDVENGILTSFSLIMHSDFYFIDTEIYTRKKTRVKLWRVFSVKIQNRILDMLFLYSNIQYCN